MNVEAIVVEVQRLDVQPGDVVLITPQKPLEDQEDRRVLIENLAALTKRTGVHFVLGSKDLVPTVIRKETT